MQAKTVKKLVHSVHHHQSALFLLMTWLLFCSSACQQFQKSEKNLFSIYPHSTKLLGFGSAVRAENCIAQFGLTFCGFNQFKEQKRFGCLPASSFHFKKLPDKKASRTKVSGSTISPFAHSPTVARVLYHFNKDRHTSHSL